jgi:hypothetical protein
MKIFNQNDILWIKNINDKKNSKSTGKSYMNKKISKDFFLHFHKNFGNNVESPRVDELILLFQKNDNGERIFTHLVTPTKIHREKPCCVKSWMGKGPKIVNKRRVKIIKKNKILVSNTLWRYVSFQGISYGKACKMTVVIPRIKKSGISLNDLLNDI